MALPACAIASTMRSSLNSFISCIAIAPLKFGSIIGSSAIGTISSFSVAILLISIIKSSSLTPAT